MNDLTAYLTEFYNDDGDRLHWIRFAPDKATHDQQVKEALARSYTAPTFLHSTPVPFPGDDPIPTRFELTCAGIVTRPTYCGPFDWHQACRLLCQLREPDYPARDVFDALDLVRQETGGYNIVYHAE